MFKFILFIFLSIPLFSQTPPLPPKPEAPKSVVIRLNVEGVKDEFELSPEAIEVFNNFWHLQRFTGSFSERFEKMIVDTTKTLLSREEYAPDNIKTQLQTVKTAEEATKTLIENKSKAKSKKRVE